MIELGVFLKTSSISTAATLKLDSSFIITIATIAFQLFLR